MNFLRLNKGITLIALIITIIVMLILVMVTINLSVKGDLFNYSKKATLDTKEAKVMEELETVKMSWEIEKNIDDDATIATFLASEKENGIIDDYTEIGEGQYYIEKDGYQKRIQGERYVTFYVYHASDNTVEEFTLRDDRTFNIFALTKEGLLYGGYFSDYYGKGSYAGDGVEVFDGTEIAYDGTNSEWVEGDAFTENGTAMHPQDGVTYYLKELPTRYLKQYPIYTYNRGDRIMRTLYVFTALDDLCYDDLGSFINETTNRKRFYGIDKPLTINHSSGPVTYSTESCFGFEDGGYIALIDFTPYLAANTSVKTTPYYVTKDGITVSGTADIRIYSFGNLTIDEYTYTRISSFDDD